MWLYVYVCVCGGGGGGEEGRAAAHCTVNDECVCIASDQLTS